MTVHQLAILQEIRRRLAVLHKEWQDAVAAGEEDGHCKSIEGAIEVGYPPWHETRDTARYAEAPASSISIYSYLFGPNRWHTFTRFEDALEEVKTWTC